MEKAYTKTNWVDNSAPFIDAEHLNNIESGIDTLDDRVVSMDSKVTEAYNNAGRALSGISVIQGTYAKKTELPEIATTESVGLVKPDGSTTYIDADGTLHAVGGGGGTGGTSDYNDLLNKPSINGITLSGNKTTSDLGISIPSKTSQLTNDSNFVTQDILKSLIETQSFSKDNVEISNYTTITFDVAKSGYTPLGVFLYSIENATSSGVGRVYCSVFEMSITDNVLTVGIKYTGNSSAKVKATFVVLYERD